MSEMENWFGGFNNRLNIVGGIRELKARPREIIQAKTERKSVKHITNHQQSVNSPYVIRVLELTIYIIGVTEKGKREIIEQKKYLKIAEQY